MKLTSAEQAARVGAALETCPRIVITGASGWLGLTALDLLHDALGSEHFAKKVVAFGSAARLVEVRPGVAVQQSPLNTLADLPPEPTLLLHLAFLTKDKAERMSEEQYVAANLALREQVLNSLDAIGVTGLFIASSGAAYRADDAAASPAMRSYGQLKRADESIFADWASARMATAVIGRIFSLSGPFINKPEVYALASFILDALARRPILVRAERPVYRSYVSARELMALALLMTAQARGVVRFDSGGEPLEMGELATLVAKQLGSVPVNRPRFEPSAMEDRYVGDGRRYSWLLNQGLGEPRDIGSQVADTAAFLSKKALPQEVESG